MQIKQSIKRVLTGAALAGALLVAAPHKAEAQRIAFGVTIGHPYYGYGYRPYGYGYYGYRPYVVAPPPPVVYGGYYRPFGYRHYYYGRPYGYYGHRY